MSLVRDAIYREINEYLCFYLYEILFILNMYLLMIIIIAVKISFVDSEFTSTNIIEFTISNSTILRHSV